MEKRPKWESGAPTSPPPEQHRQVTDSMTLKEKLAFASQEYPSKGMNVAAKLDARQHLHQEKLSEGS